MGVGVGRETEEGGGGRRGTVIGKKANNDG